MVTGLELEPFGSLKSLCQGFALPGACLQMRVPEPSAWSDSKQPCHKHQSSSSFGAYGKVFLNRTMNAARAPFGAKLGVMIKSPFLDRSLKVRNQWLQLFLVLIDLNLYHGK